MAQPLNDLLCTLRLFHLISKESDLNVKAEKRVIKQRDYSTETVHHRLTTFSTPVSGTRTPLRTPLNATRKNKHPPLRLIHHYRPICLQKIQPDPPPIHPQSSSRSPPRLSNAAYDPSSALFLRTIYKSPKQLKRRRDYSPFLAARIVSEVRREQQARNRRFDAIIADVTAELRLPDV